MARRLRFLAFVSVLFIAPALVFSQMSAGDWTALFRAGEQAMRAGEFQSAASDFKKVLAERPGMPEAELNLGLAYNALGEYHLAAAQLADAARQRPQLFAAHLFLGIDYLKLGEAAKAIPPLEAAARIDPSNLQAGRALGNAEMSAGFFQKAAAQFQKVSAAEPDQAAALFGLGHDYLRMARQLSGKVSLNYPHSAWSFRLAGDVESERNLWADAAAEYAKALAIAPNDSEIQDSLGHALAESGKPQESARAFKAALTANPGDLKALLGLAALEIQAGNAPDGLTKVESVWRRTPDLLVWSLPQFQPKLTPAASLRAADAVARTPASPARSFLLAALYQSAGDESKAGQEEQTLEQALARQVKRDAGSGAEGASACHNHEERPCANYLTAQPQLSVAQLLELGSIFSDLHQDQPAATAFSILLARAPNDPGAMYRLSEAYLRLSEGCFSKLAASAPNSWQALELKGDALRARGSKSEALAAYRAAEQINPSDAEIHQAIAEVLLEQNDTGPAQAELQKALRLDPASARSLYLMGNLCIYERQPARGIPYLEAALRLDPGMAEARPALGKAYLRTGKPALAAAQLKLSLAHDRYGDLHYLLYQAYRAEGKSQLAAQALAQSQALRRESEAEDQAMMHGAHAN